MSTELKEQSAQPKQLTIKQHLMSDGLKAQIAAALPKHMSADRMARVALTTINKTPKLAQCTQESFFAALMTCSQLGLEPDGRLAHLIPYGNQCQLIVDYKGLVDLAYRSKQVLSIHADVIYEGDEFEYDLGQVRKHTPWWCRRDKDRPESQGARIGAYCIVRMIDAEKHEVMSVDDVDAIKKRSKSSSSGPWVTDYNEMAKKTVFKRASKWIPFSPEIRDGIVADEDEYEVVQPKITTFDALAGEIDADPLGG